MKLLVLNWLDRENPDAGGAEIHLHETLGRLARRGWDITLVSSGWRGAPRRTVLDGMEVHRVGGRFTFAFLAVPYVRFLFQNERFDLVIEDLNKIPLFLPLWVPAPTLLVVHHLFGRTAFQAASFPIACVTWILELAVPGIYRDTPVVAVSGSTRRDLIRRGVRSELIEVVENGIDPDRYVPGLEGERFAEPTLVYLGRLRRYKRVDLILQAVSLLKRRGINVRLLIAGRGDEEAALREEALRLDLPPGMVTFLGFVSDEKKLELLQRGWVHILTSPNEGWGIANIEAAACGTPTVASDAPGLRDSVEDGETGFLVPHGDVEGLALRIEQLLLDESLRRQLGRRARSFAEELSWEVTSERFAQSIEKVAPGGMS